MNNSDKEPTDTETMLMALDQISQTVDVMNSVVERLRSYLEHRRDSTETPVDLRREMSTDRILH
jgi:hypothetical protein